jgi:hypothetical protein
MNRRDQLKSTAEIDYSSSSRCRWIWLNFLSTPWNSTEFHPNEIWCIGRVSGESQAIISSSQASILWINGYDDRNETLVNRMVGSVPGACCSVNFVQASHSAQPSRSLSRSRLYPHGSSSLAHRWFFSVLAASHLSLLCVVSIVLPYCVCYICCVCFVPLLARNGALDRLFDCIVSIDQLERSLTDVRSRARSRVLRSVRLTSIKF